MAKVGISSALCAGWLSRFLFGLECRFTRLCGVEVPVATGTEHPLCVFPCLVSFYSCAGHAYYISLVAALEASATTEDEDKVDTHPNQLAARTASRPHTHIRATIG